MVLKKIMVVVLLAISLCAGLNMQASAETTNLTDYGVAPAYEIANNAISTMSINGSTATCLSNATGTNTVKISVTQTLQKYSGLLWIWNDVDNASWSKTSNANAISLTSTKSGLSSGTYRLKSVFTLTNSSGETETITVYSDEKTI